MVTLAALRSAFVGIVDRHVLDFTTTSEWTTALDGTAHADTWPKCIWGPPSVILTTAAPGRLTETFTIDALFLDFTAPDRTRDERDAVVSEMDAAARQCFLLFFQENIRTTTDLDLRLIDGPRIEAVYDRSGDACSGVRMTFTIADNGQPACVDEYFAAS